MFNGHYCKQDRKGIIFNTFNDIVQVWFLKMQITREKFNFLSHFSSQSFLFRSKSLILHSNLNPLI